MKTIRSLIFWAWLFVIFMPCQSCSQCDTTEKDTYYFGVEINGMLCGYIKMTTCSFIKDEKDYGLIKTEVLNKLSILGGDMDIRIESEIVFDPNGTGYSAQVADINLGEMQIHTEISIKDRIAHYEERSSGTSKKVELGPDVVVELPIANPHLKRDFIDGQMENKTYEVYDDRTGEVIEKTYTKLGEQELYLAGKIYEVTVLEELSQSQGLKSKVYLDVRSGMTIRHDLTEDRSIYLADASIVDKIGVVDMDNVLFAKVNEYIPEFKNLAFMKVRAKIKSSGEWLTAESLSFRGQTFTGTVEDNFIDGVFVIEPVRYHGEDAPGFPYDYELPDSLQKYLEPEVLIESNEQVIIDKANEITVGAIDSWEAAVRLSSWVNENIKGAIPGGTSAINTYKTREGECGSHSRLLAAFCRAVGIPARMVIGCAYINERGGFFGQHGWTEVYMGNAGWIPVDATFGEVDYVDAGHIKLGEKSSFYPSEMEILEYRYATGEGGEVSSEIPDMYKPFIGKYKVIKTGNNFEILYRNDKLAVDIPNKMVLTLDDPDEEGRWYPQLTREINFTFHLNDDGQADEMCLYQNILFTRGNEQEEITKEIPADLQPYVGKYKLISVAGDFVVYHNNGSLELDDPTNDLVIKLNPTEQPGSYVVDTTEDKVHFRTDEDGNVDGMLICTILRMPKTETISSMDD